MEQRTLQIGNRIIYCYEDGSVQFKSTARSQDMQLVRTFGTVDVKGYKVISLNINSKPKKLKVHRLIALAFHPNPDNLPQIDHINRDKSDNRPCNLRWCDNKTNVDNRDCVDCSIRKYGVRWCDNEKAYSKARAKFCLNMYRPDGGRSTTGALTPEVYNMLKPLSEKERYIKYQELKSMNYNSSI